MTDMARLSRQVELKLTSPGRQARFPQQLKNGAVQAMRNVGNAVCVPISATRLISPGNVEICRKTAAETHRLLKNRADQRNY
jgi:hypothetical protein